MSPGQPRPDSDRAEPAQPEPAAADRPPPYPSGDDVFRLAQVQARQFARFIQEVIDTLRRGKNGASLRPPLDEAINR